LRQVIAFIPVVILVFAYHHRIPLPPELMLVDLLAYIDIFSALFLLGVLARAATVLFLVRQVIARATRLLSSLLEGMQRPDLRHRREGGAKNRKRRLTNLAKDDDDANVVVIHCVAWA
jgi:hypothetical protein